MNTILYEFAKLLKKLHDFIVRNSNHLSDKALHFIVFGFAGLLIFVLTYPMFKRFYKMGKSKTMAAIYTLATTVILTITMSFVLDVTQDFIFVPFIFGFMIFLFSRRESSIGVFLICVQRLPFSIPWHPLSLNCYCKIHNNFF